MIVPIMVLIGIMWAKEQLFRRMLYGMQVIEIMRQEKNLPNLFETDEQTVGTHLAVDPWMHI